MIEHGIFISKILLQEKADGKMEITKDGIGSRTGTVTQIRVNNDIMEKKPEKKYSTLKNAVSR